MPPESYRLFANAQKDVGCYLMDYYNGYCPHQNNNGVTPIMAEKLKLLSGNT